MTAQLATRGTRIGAARSYQPRPYVYRGTIPAVADPVINSSTALCGTRQGYKRHVRLGTDTCQPCRDVVAAKSRERRAVKNAANPKVNREFSPDKCGTSAGYSRHNYWNQEPCEPCRVARRAYEATYRPRRKRKP